jgi:hypothetical protein
VLESVRAPRKRESPRLLSGLWLIAQCSSSCIFPVSIHERGNLVQALPSSPVGFRRCGGSRGRPRQSPWAATWGRSHQNLQTSCCALRLDQQLHFASSAPAGAKDGSPRREPWVRSGPRIQVALLLLKPRQGRKNGPRRVSYAPAGAQGKKNLRRAQRRVPTAYAVGYLLTPHPGLKTPNLRCRAGNTSPVQSPLAS